MKLKLLVLSAFLFGGFAEESIKPTLTDSGRKLRSPPEVIIHSENLPVGPIQNEKFSPYVGGILLFPGMGVEYRTRDNYKGRALNLSSYEMSAKPSFSIHNSSIVSLDYNFVTFFRDGQVSPYASYGIGATAVGDSGVLGLPLPLPYAPLRMGCDFKYGFVDCGARMYLLYVPIPEVRGGVSVPF